MAAGGRYLVLALVGAAIGCDGAQRTAPASPAPPEAGAPSRVEFEYFDHRILLPVRLNGRGPFTFIFDTGGGNVITPEVAAALGLTPTPAGVASGAGDSTIPMGTTRIGTVQCGDVTLGDQPFMVIELAPIARAFGFPRLDGVIGLELLQQQQASIDYRSRTVTFTPLSADPPLPPGVEIGFELVQGKPVIPARVDGVATRVMIDTGDRSAFTLFRRFAEAHQMEAGFPGPDLVTGVGVGGPIPARLGTTRELDLGEGAAVPLRGVHTRLPSTTRDAFATSSLGGSIGNGVLDGFVATFDYQRKRLSLARRPGPAQPYVFVPPRSTE